MQDRCHVRVVCKGLYHHRANSMNYHYNGSTTIRCDIFHELLATLLQVQVIPVTFGILRGAES
jgi:hypothetical protein